MTSLLIVPGLGGSGPVHWQTRWEALDPRSMRVEQHDWDEPECTAWCESLERSVSAAPAPIVLVAHSLGCITVAHWAAQGSVSRVRAALLVAPADVEREPTHPLVPSCFRPVPRAALPFRSMVVASSNDPHAALERAREFAQSWGAEFVDVGALGHINADSRLGDWEQGRALLSRLL
jgi:predicted alpha/beta hydrolase family esterase